MAITATVPEPRPPSSFGASSNRCADVRLGNRSQLRCDRDCLILAWLTRFTCLLDFRDSYGLLDHLNSDGFDYWSDRLFHFPRGFLHWRVFGLALVTVRFVAFALADLDTLRALPRAVAPFFFCTFDPFLRLAMIFPLFWLVPAPAHLTQHGRVPATKQSSYQQIVL